MNRRLSLVAAACAAAFFIGAAPQEPVRVVEGWGAVVDPDRDCRIRSTGRGVVIEVPGTLHDLMAEVGKTNAPRIVDEVDGDFIAEVRVEGELRPRGRCTREGGVPFNGAGLLLWKDDETYLRLERSATLRPDGIASFVCLEARREGQPAGSSVVAVPDGPAWLRLERRGDRVLASFSVDGKNWFGLDPPAFRAPGRVLVGVAAVNSDSEPFTARLEGFEVFVRRPGPTENP